MKAKLKFIAAAASLMVASAGAVAQEAGTLEQLLNQVKSNRVSEAKVNEQREAEFRSARADKQALLRKAQAALKAEEDRGVRLNKQFAANEVTLTEKATELEQALGTLGEMFGVVRQASSEAYGLVSNSIVSAEFPGRGEFLANMASESRGLPKLNELEDLWFALQTEMTESGQVSKFTTEVVSLSGGTVQQEVVRVGSFNLVSEQGYLSYDSESKKVQPLGRQPASHLLSSATELADASAGIVPFYVDPSAGQILSLLKRKATMTERFHAGAEPGYVITGMLIIGLLIGFYKIITLSMVSGKIRSQLKNTSTPSSNNPLGRILAVYQNNKNVDAESLELKLDEAILKELPSIDSGINVIKIFAAIAPLLGLLGTVLGMIETFQTITLFGTGDPRQMAGSISMALVTTAQGIIAALPLILMHSVVASRSKSIVHVLDEQTAGVIAAHAESEKA